MKIHMIEVRTPSPDDKDRWLPLWRAYLAFYETDLAPQVTDLTWERFHDPAESLHLIGAYRDEDMIGFATYLLHRSTWAEKWYCYLEDLFVDDRARGSGAGRALMAEVRGRAVAAGARRLYWNTREDNTTARQLYDKVAPVSPFVLYRADLGSL